MHSRRCIALFCFVLSWSLALTQQDWNRDRNRDSNRDENDYDQRDLYKLGEFNDRCKSKKDCRQFGYVCRNNRTCQCDFMYIPDVKKRSCVGGVNQRCIYDEHCIEGAFCMNQAVCKCKNSSPIELEDGLVCAGANQQKPIKWPFIGSALFVLCTQLGRKFDIL